MLAACAVPVAAQTTHRRRSALAEQPQPDLVKLLPPRSRRRSRSSSRVALGSPPDDFRNEKGEIAGWEIDILHAATQALGLELQICARPRSTR